MPFAGLLVALLPLATPSPDSGLAWAVTLSGSRPTGVLNADERAIAREFGAAWSLGAEGCWRYRHALELGVAADLGYTPLAPTACPADGTCFGLLGRAVALLRLRAAPHPRFDTWISAATGFLWLDARVLRVTQRQYGQELLRLAVGVDLRTGERLSLGLFGSWSTDLLLRESVRAPGYPLERAPIENRDRHGWVTVGLRGTFGPARRASEP